MEEFKNGLKSKTRNYLKIENISSTIIWVAVLVLFNSIYAQQHSSYNKLSAQEAQEGFSLLFDGTLSSFKNNFSITQ